MNCFVFRICKSDFRMFKERISCPEARLPRLFRVTGSQIVGMPQLHSIATFTASPSLTITALCFSVGGRAQLILTQLRYLPAAENSDPGATWIFSRHSCLATQTISTCSGSSTHSIKPPFGRVTQIPQGKNSRSQQV